MNGGFISGPTQTNSTSTDQKVCMFAKSAMRTFSCQAQNTIPDRAGLHFTMWLTRLKWLSELMHLEVSLRIVPRQV